MTASPRQAEFTREALIQWLEQQLYPHRIKRLPGARRYDRLALAAAQLRQVSPPPTPAPQPPLLP